MVKKSYDGSSCPVSSYGLVVAICAPRCMEAKVPVNEGDVMMVTRWERRWVYGSLMQGQLGPHACVMCVHEHVMCLLSCLCNTNAGYVLFS